jgi:hypothetical protein
MSDLDQFTPQIPAITSLHADVCSKYGISYTPNTLAQDLQGNATTVAQALCEQLGDFAQAVHGAYQGYNIQRPLLNTHPHSWVNFLGTVIDPLRWVFEGKEPYIFEGESIGEDYVYDEDFSARLFPFTAPARNEVPTSHKFQWSSATQAFLNEVVFADARDVSALTLSEIHFIAHLPFQYLLPHMPEIYQAIIDGGYSNALTNRALTYHHTVLGEMARPPED